MTPPAGGDAGFLMSQPGGNGASGAEPATSHGRTHIAETVVSKIAGLAAREASGVYALGGGAARAFAAIRERMPGASSNVSQGVAVEVGERQSAWKALGAPAEIMSGRAEKTRTGDGDGPARGTRP